MTKIRRAAQVVEDLKTLGVITDNQVLCFPSLREGKISLSIQVPKNDPQKYFVVKDAFEQEFLNDIEIIEDSEFVQCIF